VKPSDKKAKLIYTPRPLGQITINDFELRDYEPKTNHLTFEVAV